jgi:putative membrane protein
MVAMMLWYGGHWAFWQAGLMWAGMIVFWGLLIWGIYALVSSSRRPDARERGSDARRILDERLARGEISTEEHQRLVDAISGGRPRAPAGSGQTP